MAAIIDWYSKAVLSWEISNTMDSILVMKVLNDALDKYGVPEIFNTDQGAQFTSNNFISILTRIFHEASKIYWRKRANKQL